MQTLWICPVWPCWHTKVDRVVQTLGMMSIMGVLRWPLFRRMSADEFDGFGKAAIIEGLAPDSEVKSSIL